MDRRQGSFRVLVLEDNAPLRKGIVRVARAEGWVTGEAATVSQAVASLRTQWDALICDIALPDGSGCTVVERVREVAPSTVIVVITGAATHEETFTLGRLGVDAYLRKPFRASEVISVLQRTLDRVKVKFDDLPYSARLNAIARALRVCAGNKTLAAATLGISRQRVQYWARRADL